MHPDQAEAAALVEPQRITLSLVVMTHRAGPGLTAALAELRGGDTLVVWKLDQLGRSVKDVLTIANDLHAQGVGVKILTGKLSGTYSPTGEGKFFFTMMAAFARARAGHHPRAHHGRPGRRPSARTRWRAPDRDGRRQSRRR